MTKESKKVLVTGSLGFIGSNLVRELEKRGHEVWVCDLLRSCRSNYVRARMAGLWFGVDVTLEFLRIHTISRFPTVMLSVLLIIGAMQFFTLGLVVDMIKRLRRRKW